MLNYLTLANLFGSGQELSSRPAFGIVGKRRIEVPRGDPVAKETRRRPPTVAPVLVEPDEQADHHRQTRLARQTEIAED